MSEPGLSQRIGILRSAQNDTWSISKLAEVLVADLRVCARLQDGTC